MTPEEIREYQFKLIDKLFDNQFEDLEKAEHENELNEILTELNIEV